MFKFTQCLVFHKKPSEKSGFNDPPGVREIFRESDDIENQIRLPYSLNGITNAPFVEPANAKGESHHRASLKRYLLFNIDRRWTDVILVLCGFVSGLVDGLSFAYWKSFSDMQTGNIIWAALGVAGKPDNPDGLWIKALIAVAAFLVGIFCFTYGSWLLGPLRRITVILSFFIQTISLLIAAVLVQTNMIDDTPTQDPTQWLEDVAIALLAFQAAGQILASKFLGFPEIPTVALTALMCDLFLDKNLFQQPLSSNPKRNRKLGFIVSLTFGSMTAGGVAKDYGLASGFWLAMALKGAMTVSWFFWPETPPSEPSGEKEVA